MLLPQYDRLSSTPLKKQAKLQFLYFNLYILDSKQEDKRFCTEW